MEAQAQTTIGESMAMVAMMVGIDPEEIEGFVVIINTKGEDGYLLHNSQTYLTLIGTLLHRAQSLMGEMEVDQLITFGPPEKT